jgi:poly(3-hydroxybutyrate) depolymerase
MPPRPVCPTAPSLSSLLLGIGLALSVGCSDDANTDGNLPQGGSGGSAAGSVGASGAGSGGVATAGAAGAVGNGGSSGGAAGGASAGMGGSGGHGGGGTGGAAAGGTGGTGGTGGSGPMKSGGCGQTRTLQDGNHKLQSGGTERSYTLRAPANYDSAHPYRLILGFHGAGGKGTDVAPSYLGLWELSEGSTIFAAPDAVGGIWKADVDKTMVSDLIDQLKEDLCIDTAHIAIEGFSQGGAMVWTLACALPGKFSAAVVHSGGGLPMPTTCQPIPFWSALGNDGSDQTMSSDFFAKANGCMVEPLPKPPAGGHACTDYAGCSAGHPTRWCDYDGPHTPSHADPGQSKSWVPEEVWNFVKKF